MVCLGQVANAALSVGHIPLTLSDAFPRLSASCRPSIECAQRLLLHQWDTQVPVCLQHSARYMVPAVSEGSRDTARMHSAVVTASSIATAAFSCPCHRWQGPFSGQQFAHSELLLACAPTPQADPAMRCSQTQAHPQGSSGSPALTCCALYTCSRKALH